MSKSVQDVIAAAESGKRILLRHLAIMPEAELREVHALMYLGRDGGTLDASRLLDKGEPRDVVEDTIASKAPLASYLRAGLARARGELA